MMQRALKWLAASGADLAALGCAVVMLVAVVVTMPWSVPNHSVGTAAVMGSADAAGQAPAQTMSGGVPSFGGAAQTTEAEDASGSAAASADAAARAQGQTMPSGIRPFGSTAQTTETEDAAGGAAASADAATGEAQTSASGSQSSDEAAAQTTETGAASGSAAAGQTAQAGAARGSWRSALTETASGALSGQTGTLAESQGTLLDTLASFAPYLIVVGAVIAVAGALWHMLRPDERSRALAPLVIAAGGVVALVYFVYFFAAFFVGGDSPALADLTSLVTPGFWVALAGAGGLLVLSALPRPRLAEVSPTASQPTLEPARQSAPAPSQPAAETGRRVTPPPVVQAPTESPKPAASKSLIREAGVTGINFFQNIRVAFDALMANKLRSALTMLGVIIGVAAVVSLISVGQSASASITNRIEGAGANSITVRARGRDATYTLTLSEVEAFESRLSDIVGVAPQNNLGGTVKYGSTSVNISVTATTAAYAAVNVLEMNQGRFLNAGDQEDRAQVAVLGSQAAEDLFGEMSAVGQAIRINDVKFTVVGVAKPAGSGGGFGDPDSVVYVPLSTASRRLSSTMTIVGGKETVNAIQVLAESSDVVPQVIDEIEALLRDRFNILPDEDLPFGVFSASTLLDTVESVFNTLTVFLAAIGGISLLVGGIGIMNITLVSVTERTKEIGLRKAVGAQRLHILVQFLIETVVLSASGGIVGIIISGGILMLVNASGLMTAFLSANAVALGFGFSVLVGVVFGLYPANRAARLQPIEALRYE